MPKRTNETITLGSGKLYALEFPSTGTLPEDATIETEQNRLAWIKGGASLEYTGEFYDAKDDLGMVSKRKLTTEEVKLISGIMTWNGQVLKKLCSTARVTETGGIRTVKIGGTANDDGKSYIIHFVHEDPVDGDVRITIVGQNTSGFTLQFAADAETVIDAEFSAVSGKLDDEGTLVIIKEEIDATA